MRALFAFSLVLVAGCVHSQISANSNTHVPVSTVPAGTTVTSGALGLQATGSGAAAAAVVIITGVAISAGAGSDGTGITATPALDPARTVSEQDCTKPVDLSAGNLRCR